MCVCTDMYICIYCICVMYMYIYFYICFIHFNIKWIMTNF